MVTSHLENEPIGYSSGEWWQDDSLNALLLSASQIVVSYVGAQSLGPPVPFDPPARTKEEALRIARSLRRELRANPARFAELARRHSDEPVTAAMRGALGNFYALSMPREIVDALGHTKIGEVSRIVETPQGYHLLLRHAVTTDGKLAFAHLVIKPAGATGFRRGDRPPAERTRAEARALAQELAAEARRNPESFAALVQQHSDAEDALRAGDVGLWPRSELLAGEFLLFEVASRLAMGAVSGVVETPSGFHVLKRTSEQQRQLFAMSAITILHDRSQFLTDDARVTRTKDEALSRARKLLADLKARPQRFVERQREHCEIAFCDGISAFEEGRGPPAVERALRQIDVGEVASDPVDASFGFVLLRRERPPPESAADRIAPRTEFGPSKYPDLTRHGAAVALERAR